MTLSQLLSTSIVNHTPTPADACCPALLVDALIDRRTLFERSELVRFPTICVHLFVMRPDWASLVLVTFAVTKVARLPGRTPAKLQLGMV